VSEFVGAWKSGDYPYGAFYKGKTRPGMHPDRLMDVTPRSAPASDEEARRIIVQTKRFEKTQNYIAITFVGSAGRTDTYVLAKQPISELFSGTVAPQSRVRDIAVDVQAKLLAKGLHSLGTRYGKAGEQFGMHDSARRIGVGGRDLLLNYFLVQIDDEYSLRKPVIGWRLYKDFLLSKTTDDLIDKAVAWVKTGPTMQAVRDAARQEYQEKLARTPGERVYVSRYGWERV
jgi:hypothetical protein